MSRLGKLPIILPQGTQVKVEDGFIVVKGPKGELKEKLNSLVKIVTQDTSAGIAQGKEVIVSVTNPQNKTERSMWGLFRSLINNMVLGVNQSFEKKLEVNGVGYKASANGNILTLNVGYSHPVEFKIPEGISIEVERNIIIVSGIDKQLVGEVTSQIRRVRKPEPYKGKGIKYIDEIIRRKVGKSAVKSE
ncbi:MAG: 50S ribosomal protein L6 [Patescibacteria group bacterium]